MHDLQTVPELSLNAFTQGDAGDRAAFVDGLWTGLRQFGFIILKDHGVDPAVLTRAYDVSAAYFSQSETVKHACLAGTGGQRGYVPFGKEHAKDASVADLKEFFHIGREDILHEVNRARFEPNLWPSTPREFRDTFLDLYRVLETAGKCVLDALETPLDVPKGYFRTIVDDGNSILRLLHYPPIPENADPNAVRAAAHEDINLITILVAANGSGLELLDRNGAWLPIETAPENMIVDAGDMLARITNGVIPATTHRVVNPSGPNVSRYSMPFFLHPHPDAMLSCIESCRGAGDPPPPIRADDFLQQRLRDIGLIS